MFIEFDTYNTTNTGFIGMPGTSSSFGAQGDMTLILNGLNNPSPSAFNVYQNNGNNISPAYRVPFKIDANANVIHNGNVDIMIGGTGVGPSSVSGQLAMGCNNSAYGWVQMFGANKHLLLNPVNGGGNVGIGPGVTTAPAYTCTINGSLGVTGNVTEYGAVSQYGSNTIYDPSNTTKYYQISPATSSIYVGDNNLTFDLQGNIRSFIFQGGNNIQLGSTGSTSQKVYYQGFSPMVPITNMNFNQYQYQFLDFGSSPLAVGGGSYAINGSAISYSSSSLKYGYVEILVECTVNTWYNIRYSINQYGSISINEYTHQVITGTPATNRWIYAKQNYLFVRGTLTDNTGGGTGVLSIQITTT
jgi:hypothetical protein